jgi:hypothetical protein
VTRWEVGLALGLGLLTAAYARPRVQTFLHRTWRAEVGVVLEDLRAAQTAHRRAQQDWFDLPASPRSPGHVGTNAVPWSGTERWSPPLPSLRGSYRTERTDEGIRYIGECDVDGDGVRAVYTASPGGAPRRITPDHVY